MCRQGRLFLFSCRPVEATEQAQGTQIRAVGYLTISALLWGGVFHVIKIPLAQAPPFVVLFARFGLSALVLSPYLLNRGHYRLIWRRENLSEIVLLSLTGVCLYNAFFTYGMKLTEPATGSLIIAANPVMTTLLARFWKNEQVSPIRWLGIAFAFVGLAVIVLEGSLNNLRRLQIAPGNLILLVAPFLWAAYSIRSRDLLSRMPAGVFTAAVVAFSLPPQLAAAVLQFDGWQWGSNTNYWLSIAYLGVLSTGVAYMFWNRGVSLIGAARSSIFVNLIPVTALLISVVLGQGLLPFHLAGGAVVVAGVFLATRK